jgi:hypothetical protein
VLSIAYTDRRRAPYSPYYSATMMAGHHTIRVDPVTPDSLQWIFVLLSQPYSAWQPWAFGIGRTGYTNFLLRFSSQSPSVI